MNERESTAPPAGRWRALAIVGVGLVMAMASWFSAAAILPALAERWSLDAGSASWLTIWVQIGFVVGALGSGMTGIPDSIPLKRLMGGAALLTAGSNAAMLIAPSAEIAFAARFVTGLALAGIYPPAMKLIASWFMHGRGFALGAVIGALTLGSAAPHLIRALSVGLDPDMVIAASSVLALGSAVLLGLVVKEGPFPFGKARFDPRAMLGTLKDRALLLANLGYLGHMWELYAMWGWFLAFATSALGVLGGDARAASFLTFAVIAAGVPGAVLGGLMADRIGRTATAAIMLALSGGCALLIGFAFDGPFWILALVALVWGFAVIGDSAQFSAMVTELSDQSRVGAALALQLGLGFALTVVSLRVTPVVAEWIGWRWTFLILVPGPVVGLIAMLALRRHPDAVRIAHGLR